MIWHSYEQNWTPLILKNTLFLSFCKMIFARKFEELTQKLVYKSSCKIHKPPKETLHKFISSINSGCNCTREKPNISSLVLALNLIKMPDLSQFLFIRILILVRKTNVDYGKLSLQICGGGLFPVSRSKAASYHAEPMGIQEMPHLEPNKCFQLRRASHPSNIYE